MVPGGSHILIGQAMLDGSASKQMKQLHEEAAAATKHAGTAPADERHLAPTRWLDEFENTISVRTTLYEATEHFFALSFQAAVVALHCL